MKRMTNWKYVLFISIMLLTFSCTQKIDDLDNRVDNLEKDVVELKEKIADINKSIAEFQRFIKASKNELRIKKVIRLDEGGYRIEFENAESIEVRDGRDGRTGTDGKDGRDGRDGTDGRDGRNPVISVKEDNGKLYWTIDGEYLLHNGSKIEASTITPRIRIHNGQFQISYDNEKTWENLGPSENETPNVGIKEIDTSDPNVVKFIFYDDSTICIPITREFTLLVQNGISLSINEGETKEIPFTIEGATATIERVTARIEDATTTIEGTTARIEGTTARIEVKAYSNNKKYTIEVVFNEDNMSGIIKVTAPTPLEEAIITIIADNGKGKQSSKTIIVDPSSTEQKPIDGSEDGGSVSAVEAEPGDILIQEIFYCGGDNIVDWFNISKKGGQYFILKNNSDKNIYLDNLAIAISTYYQTTESDYTGIYSYPNPKESFASRYIYKFPGSGTENVIGAGKSICVAGKAQEWTIEDSYSKRFKINLTDAEYETYRDFDADNHLVKNPNSKQMETFLYKGKEKKSMLSADGNAENYAIIKIPSEVTKEVFAKEYMSSSYSYTYEAGPGSSEVISIPELYLVPRLWIIDAVNINAGNIFMSPEDSGRANTSEINYGAYPQKINSLYRKIGSDGKLIDTNNSSADFEIKIPSKKIAL